MKNDDEAPSWSQRDGARSQRQFPKTNTRAKRLRREQTPAERELWKVLRLLNREGFHFRRQLAIGSWVYDFGDLSRGLLIEVDGGVHERLADVVARDVEKATWAAENGFTLIRFPNRAVLDEEAVIKRLRGLDSDPHP